MTGITPHLWFDKEAGKAAAFYVSTFPDSRITHVRSLQNTPSGDVDLASFELAGLGFMAIGAGPLFPFNPSISFLVACATTDEVDALWAKLSDGGRARMPLGAYPFSERYGWTEDRYGVSWQIMFTEDRPSRQRIVPTLMFTGQVAGRAEEAIGLYTSIFPGSRVDHLLRYHDGEEPDRAGTVKHAGFALDHQAFAAMDSARVHDAAFNEANSLVVHCDTQEEVDHFWERLSAGGEPGRCGWLKDQYGVSWQVTPSVLGRLMSDPDPARSQAVLQAMLQMNRIVIADLQAAYDGASGRSAG